MSYDPIREADTIEDLISEYGMDGYDDPVHPYETMQVELLEALNQIGPETLDDTRKRNAFWSIIRTLAILRTVNNGGLNRFHTEDIADEIPFDRYRDSTKVVLRGENGDFESIVTD